MLSRRYKKAQMNKPFAVVVGIVILLALAIVVYIAFIKPSGKSASELFGSIGSCSDPLLGQEGSCDCFFEPAECPMASQDDSQINTNCPNAAKYGRCDNNNYNTLWKKAKEDYEKKVKEIKKELNTDLGPDQLRVIKAQHFGRCCPGAEAPTSQ